MKLPRINTEESLVGIVAFLFVLGIGFWRQDYKLLIAGESASQLGKTLGVSTSKAKKPTRTPTPTLTPTRTPTPTFSPTPTLKVTLTPTATPTATVTPTPQVSNDSGGIPAQVLNLTNWKVTVPLGGSEKPTEIKQPELATYKLDPWFIAVSGGVRFRAPVNAVTTSGSNYPRSELREMTNNGEKNASWSSNSGTHTMFLEQAITAVPEKKKHVVAGQIHDADDDVIVVRLEYPTLYVNVDGKNLHTLDSDYTLGERFKVKFVVSDNQTKIYYNDSSDPVYTLSKSYSGAYFKAGAYTQSNCSKEESSSCNSNNYGEVIVYQVTVTH